MKTSQSYLQLTSTLLLFLFIYHTDTAAQITAINDTIYITNLNDITINVLLNDIVEINEATTISIVSQPMFGTIESNLSNAIVYTPFSNFIDEQLNDNFSYIINGESNEAQVFITQKDCPACVWPGDTDRDGIVNVWDLLPIGLAYGSTGIPRSVQSNNWNGFPIAENWGEVLYENDYKYIDCNGDGTINDDDLAAIDQNYDAVHGFGTPPDIPPATSSSEISLALNILNEDDISLGDTVIIDVILGFSGQTPQDLYGVVFSISLPEDLVQSVEIDFSESVVGNALNTISLSKTLVNNTRFDAAIVRKDQTDITEIGVVGKINVVMVEVLEGKTNDFEIPVNLILDNFRAVNAAGESLTINLVLDDDFMFVGTGNTVESDVPKFKIYPNPTQDILAIDLPPQHDFRYLEIIDISGKTILQQNDLQLFTDKINVDTKSLNNGFYLLKMQFGETQITQKISVLRP